MFEPLNSLLVYPIHGLGTAVPYHENDRNSPERPSLGKGNWLLQRLLRRYPRSDSWRILCDCLSFASYFRVILRSRKSVSFGRNSNFTRNPKFSPETSCDLFTFRTFRVCPLFYLAGISRNIWILLYVVGPHQLCLHSYFLLNDHYLLMR